MQSFFKFLKLFKYFKQIYQFAINLITNRKNAKVISDLEKVEQKIDDSNKIEDDKERLDKKKEAARELEKIISGN